MTYPPTGPGYPSSGPAGPGQPPAASAQGGGSLISKPLPYLFSIAVLVLGVAGFLFGFAPYMKVTGFSAAAVSQNSFEGGYPAIGLALLLAGGLFAGVSLLPGQSQQAAAAVTSLVGFVVGLFFLFNLSDGVSLAWGGVLGLVLAFVQSALAVTLLLFTVGIVQPPAPRSAGYQPQQFGAPGYGPQPGYAPGFGQAPPQAGPIGQPGYGQPQPGYGAPNPYATPQQPYTPPQQYGQAPQYGQTQQFGQAPQYGQAPQQYGESQPYGQPQHAQSPTPPSAEPSPTSSSSDTPAGPSSSTPTQAFGVDKPERTDD